jgi:hypothetical protein
LFAAEGILGFVLGWNVSVCLYLIGFGGYLIFEAKVWGPRRFGDEIILVQTSYGRSEIAWERFSRFVETDKLFVLFGAPRQVLTIPKRILPADKFDEFLELLKRKLIAG